MQINRPLKVASVFAAAALLTGSLSACSNTPPTPSEADGTYSPSPSPTPSPITSSTATEPDPEKAGDDSLSDYERIVAIYGSELAERISVDGEILMSSIYNGGLDALLRERDGDELEYWEILQHDLTEEGYQKLVAAVKDENDHAEYELVPAVTPDGGFGITDSERGKIYSDPDRVGPPVMSTPAGDPVIYLNDAGDVVYEQDRHMRFYAKGGGHLVQLRTARFVLVPSVDGQWLIDDWATGSKTGAPTWGEDK